VIIPIDQAKPETYRTTLIHAVTNRLAVILAHLALVAGMVWIGYRHFDNIQTGVQPLHCICYHSTLVSPTKWNTLCRQCYWCGRWRLPKTNPGSLLLGLAAGHLLSIVSATIVVQLLLGRGVVGCLRVIVALGALVVS